jgi:hypothetical protein
MTTQLTTSEITAGTIRVRSTYGMTYAYADGLGVVRCYDDIAGHFVRAGSSWLTPRQIARVRKASTRNAT